jgi:hypothetical protein
LTLYSARFKKLAASVASNTMRACAPFICGEPIGETIGAVLSTSTGSLVLSPESARFPDLKANHAP